MSRADIQSTVRDILADLVDDDGLQISDETTAADVADWDSITHVRLLLALEKRFGFRFATDEADDLHDVGALVGLIEKKIGG